MLQPSNNSLTKQRRPVGRGTGHRPTCHESARGHALPMLVLLVSFLLPGCHWFGGVRLSNLATASGKPSNVATLVSVTKDGKPVGELDEAAFRVFEDDQLIDRKQSSATLLDPTLVLAFQTVVVIDLNHASTDERRRQLSRAVAAYVRKVRQRQPVTVLVYDGSPRTRLVADLSMEPTGSGPEQFDNLASMAPLDPSRNLRGAVTAGLAELDARLARSSRPLRAGTLVVFSRGPDVAGRVSLEAFDESVTSTPHRILYIGVNGDPTDSSTERLAQSHQVLAQSADTVAIAFEEAATLTSNLAEQYYLFSYCSPARAGTRTLRLEVTVPGVENEVLTDSFDASFDATGFSPGCNAATPPRFLSPARAASAAPKPGASASAPKSPASDTATSPDPEATTDDAEVPPPNKPGYAP